MRTLLRRFRSWAAELDRLVDEQTARRNIATLVAQGASDSELKDSGYGRVNGAEPVDLLLQTRSVWTELSEDAQDPFVMRI